MNFLEQDQEEIEPIFQEEKEQQILELKLSIKTLQNLLENLKKEEIEKETLIQVQKKSIEKLSLLIMEAQEEILKTSKSLPLLIEELKKENKENILKSKKELEEENQKLVASVLVTKKELDNIKTKGEVNLVEFIKDSNVVKMEFIDSIKKYFIKSFVFNMIIISLFLLGTYKFYYKETKENIEIVRDIIREDEKYWWDKENSALYRYQNNPNIKNKK